MQKHSVPQEDDRIEGMRDHWYKHYHPLKTYVLNDTHKRLTNRKEELLAREDIHPMSLGVRLVKVKLAVVNQILTERLLDGSIDK